MIVIPMAGTSRRFAEAGYGGPKHALPLWGETVFDQAVKSFSAYFETLPFLFVVRGGEAERFVSARVRALGISEARIARLDTPTAGQAETVELGLDVSGVGDGEPITIFNIDTFRPGFRFPDEPWASTSDGWLEVFRGEGANWSYVRPAEGAEPLVLETAEKRPISDLCCTGLYHFARAGDFRLAQDAERAAPSAPEFYVAPIYNRLIAQGRRIGYRLIEREAVIFCGTPDEYDALVRSGAAP